MSVGQFGGRPITDEMVVRADRAYKQRVFDDPVSDPMRRALLAAGEVDKYGERWEACLGCAPYLSLLDQLEAERGLRDGLVERLERLEQAVRGVLAAFFADVDVDAPAPSISNSEVHEAVDRLKKIFDA